MYKHLTDTPPKKIVLLSDGTGNSSAKLMKTNVWRMYQAIDLSKGDQVAMYDNGVGTSSSKPLMMLGGGIGLGLKRNVLQLYMFACQSYVPEEARRGREADELYLFGFSRGAYTVRLLAGLIDNQGLILEARGRDLEHMARWAYRRYHLTFPAMWHVRMFRAAVYNVHRLWDRMFHSRAPSLDRARTAAPPISFLGLWDTVDAYGLPVDEMTMGWDRWVWPLSPRCRKPLGSVKKVCHAVALDDERQAFHPVLYDESTADGPCGEQRPPLASSIDDERVSQVWFTGMHSDVGGGYPDDGLAHVSLCWMAEQAMCAGKGLRLFPQMIEEWQSLANPSGPIHDSRSGPAGYYRYKPRSVAALCDDDFVKVCIPRPKIHESVFERIVSGRDEYAPIVLPDRYAVVRADGAILDGAANPYEQPEQAAERVAGQVRVWDKVWLRRGVYFLNVGTSLLLVGAPFLAGTLWPSVLQGESRGSALVVDLVAKFLPGFTKPWTEYYRAFPIQLWFLLALLFGLMISSRRLESALRQDMHVEWDRVLKGEHATVRADRPASGRIAWLRSLFGDHSRFERWTQFLVPPLFGMGALFTVVLVAAAVLNRAALSVATGVGVICPHPSEIIPAGDGPWTVYFENREMCHATGVALEADHRYRLRVDLPDDGWKDGGHEITTPAGFSTLENRDLAFIVGLPFRRLLTVRWFVPIARIDSGVFAEYHPLNATAVEFSPRRDGELFLFVNDAVAVWPWWRHFYANNDGREAMVTITELP